LPARPNNASRTKALTDLRCRAAATSKLDLSGQIVLEEYTFKPASGWAGLAKLASDLAGLFPDDPVWTEVKDRLVILSNGMLSFFAQNACEVAQHVRISDETGTAAGGALFNQENVPSETLFYSVVHAFTGRGKQFKGKQPREAFDAFLKNLEAASHPFQFGGDASTGLGYCTVRLASASGSS
jgi:CRISPR-associated protein Cmr4